ncbi:4-hydroxythreonine-4-phosphate dehydrogenase PdxA [Pelagibacteraceae bacterium]|nr:4-hydroxythreonine-4-phosphate dehydrogenase PdxA [Pelagibacteraceae bacterium]
MKKIIIISGDPNSINSEIIFKSWKKINKSLKKRIFVISNYQLLKQQFLKLKYNIKMIKIDSLDKTIDSDQLKVLNVDLVFKNPFKVDIKQASKFVENSLNLAHKLAVNKKVCGMINCAIDKKLLRNKIGVTEYLANKCNIRNKSEVMLIRNKNLSVSPITTHINVRNIAKKIKPLTIENKVKTIDNWYKKIFFKRPKIGVLGLNPHNSELRKDSEEKKIIIPTILKLKNYGINIKGPIVSDTIFISNFKKYDVIIGMYHDQVLSPFKALFKFNAINITLGLKYLRLSPDHGTAFDLIGKKKASPLSLIECINFINKFIK